MYLDDLHILCWLMKSVGPVSQLSNTCRPLGSETAEHWPHYVCTSERGVSQEAQHHLRRQTQISAPRSRKLRGRVLEAQP